MDEIHKGSGVAADGGPTPNYDSGVGSRFMTDVAAQTARESVNHPDKPLWELADVDKLARGGDRDYKRVQRQFVYDHPAVPLYQLPTRVVTASFGAASPALDINVPDGAIAVQITKSNAGDVGFNVRGLATLPGAGPLVVSEDFTQYNPPPDVMYFIYGLRQISVIGTNAAFICLTFFIQDD